MSYKKCYPCPGTTVTYVPGLYTKPDLPKLPGEKARLVVVTKSGHGIHEEQTELFNREVLSFLKDLDRQPSK